MDDVSFEDIMLQLTQSMKHDMYHMSGLCGYVFMRAITSPSLLGHSLFWYLESELDAGMSPRFRLLKKQLLLSLSAPYRKEMLSQAGLVRQLNSIAKQVKEIGNLKDKRQELLQNSLQKLVEMGGFTLPVDARIRAGGVLIDKCRVLQSATCPLLLTFQNIDPLGDNIRIIYKVGDDLRQDLLTLQTIRLIDTLWQNEGMDLHVTAYRVLPTSPTAGFIAVVPNSKTTAEIHKEQGGGALGALKEEVIMDYLLKNNHGSDEQSIRNAFARSCAAYCVISYVLGIGDRHNDNIMVTASGNLFHIDFGFILGNYLKFIGIDRETTPFVLTREMVHVMGGNNSPLFNFFCTKCCWAYNVIRNHANLLLSLFSMMIGTGIPQLNSVEDLSYLKDALKLHFTDEEAADHFRDLIKKSLKNTRVYLNNIVHIMANQ